MGAKNDDGTVHEDKVDIGYAHLITGVFQFEQNLRKITTIISLYVS